MLHLDRAAPRLAPFRDRHRGADIIVCGCGKSLNELRNPAGAVTIGVNDVGRLFDPTYLVVVNPRAQFKADRFRFVQESKAKQLFTQLDLGPVRPPVVLFKLGRYGGTDTDGDVLHYTQNSPYVAVCLAAYMGAHRIGLIGVDFTEEHFFARSGRHPLHARLREIDTQYGRLAQSLGQRGIELVNLSAVSRLESLRRLHVGDDGTWMDAVPARDVPTLRTNRAAAPATATRAAPASREPGRGAMRVSIDKYGAGAVGQLLDALAGTARSLGYSVVRCAHRAAHDPGTVAIVWNGRHHAGRGPTLYCELGWLPRSDYQISPRGINATSHIAPFAWNGVPLSAEEGLSLGAHLKRIKESTHAAQYQYLEAGREVITALPGDFLLVPLQMEFDTNITRHAPRQLRTMQALIDYLAKLNPPWPVIFKQHPADARRGNFQLRLRVRRRHDAIWPQSRGNVHQMLKSKACRGILTINSNVAHDGLLWDVPAIVLGRNVWPQAGEVTPFLTAVPHDWSALQQNLLSPAVVECRRAYAYYLMANQVTLADAGDPAHVARLLDSAVAASRIPFPSPRRASIESVSQPAPKVAKRRSVPTINVVAEGRGWLFEEWKRRFARVPRSDCAVVASNQPVRDAAAWIFIRAREAQRSPDLARSVVQLHDFADGSVYAHGAERAAVRTCGAISLVHARQREILEGAGIDTGVRYSIVRPVGWMSENVVARPPGSQKPTLVWMGRPASRGSDDSSQLEVFVAAAIALQSRPRVILVGERLEKPALQLRAAGVECKVVTLDQRALRRCTEWIAGADCAAVTGETDGAPWPLFDALRAGIPVVATRVGWAPQLLADGLCGAVVEGSEAMRAAIDEILRDRARWRNRSADITARVAQFSIDAWLQANLDLAATLAGLAVERAA